MNNLPGIRSRFLQQAGLIKCVTRDVPFLALVLALLANNPFPKFQVGIIGVVGILLAYTLGRDVLTRFKYAEAGRRNDFLTAAAARECGYSLSHSFW